MFRWLSHLRSDLAYILVMAGLFVAWVLLCAAVFGIATLLDRYGLQDTVARLQTRVEVGGEVAARLLKIGAGVALGGLIIYIGVKVFTS